MCVYRYYLFICAFLPYILLYLVPKLSFCLFTVQYSVGHGACEPRARHHLWEVTHPILPFHQLQSTKTLPSGLCFNGSVTIWCPKGPLVCETAWSRYLISTALVLSPIFLDFSPFELNEFSDVCLCKPCNQRDVWPSAPACLLSCLFFLPHKCLKKFFFSLQILCKQRKCVRSPLACLHLWVQHFIFLPLLCFRMRWYTPTGLMKAGKAPAHIFWNAHDCTLSKPISDTVAVYARTCRVCAQRTLNLLLE